MTIISTKSSTKTEELLPVYLDFDRPALTFAKYRKSHPTVCFLIDTKPNRYGIIAVAKFGKDRERQFKTVQEIDNFIAWLLEAGFHKQQADYSPTEFIPAWVPTVPKKVIVHKRVESNNTFASTEATFSKDVVLSL